jgi:hypothetical protein
MHCWSSDGEQIVHWHPALNCTLRNINDPVASYSFLSSCLSVFHFAEASFMWCPLLFRNSLTCALIKKRNAAATGFFGRSTSWGQQNAFWDARKSGYSCTQDGMRWLDYGIWVLHHHSGPVTAPNFLNLDNSLPTPEHLPGIDCTGILVLENHFGFFQKLHKFRITHFQLHWKWNQCDAR